VPVSDDATRVVAFSSGNHAQAVALAGQLLDTPRVIVMPRDAPAVKRAAAEGYGAEIVLYDSRTRRPRAIGRRLSKERGLALIRPTIIPTSSPARAQPPSNCSTMWDLSTCCWFRAEAVASWLVGAVGGSPLTGMPCGRRRARREENDAIALGFRRRQAPARAHPQTVADGALRTASMSAMNICG